MATVAQTFRRSLSGVFPACVMQGQAVAFNMFLAFFPMLLLALGVMASASWMQDMMKDVPERLSAVMPPGTERVVFEYLARRGIHAWRWMWLGIGGTLLAGTQVVSGLIEGFRVIAGDEERPAFWRRQIRALLLLCLTIVPTLAAVTLTVFGRQVRTWLIQKFGVPQLMKFVAALGYASVEMLLALLVLVILYSLGWPANSSTRRFLPGAMVATVLWWVIDVLLGWYVRHMPYSLAYGGLAAAIGLLLWMYMTAMVIFVGAAYNVEADHRR